MIAIFTFIMLSSFAEEPARWSQVRSIIDRHEFYQDNEELKKPADSWQLLFALMYLDSSLRMSKDCVFYRIPGNEEGKIRVSTLAADEDCHSRILTSGDLEVHEVKKLRFALTSEGIEMNFLKKGRPQKWKISLLGKWEKPEPKLLLSSADFQSPRAIYLAPSAREPQKLYPLKNGVLCHDVTPDCQEKSSSRCRDCEDGWQEMPNGCPSGPKLCGSNDCGGKNLPACRRGMTWQRKQIEFDCRIDSSFAWCEKGLNVSCEGDRAYCR